MRESDARKDGGTYGEHTTQYDEDRYQDEPEGKREDQAQAAPREAGALSDCHHAPLTDRVSGAGDSWQQCPICNKPAQAAPAHTPWSIDADGDIQDATGNKIIDGHITDAVVKEQILEAIGWRENAENAYRGLERNHAETRAACDALAEACKRFAFAPWDYNHPDQLIVKVGNWEVYGKDLTALRAALALWEEAKK